MANDGKIFSKVDRNVFRTLTKQDLQHKNRFKLILVSAFGSGVARAILSAARTVASNLVSIFYLQSITLPSAVELEYEGNVRNKILRTMKTPSEISMTFLESEKAVVWRFLQDWRKQIVTVASTSLGNYASGLFTGNNQTEYVFADNQNAAKKLGILLINTGNDKNLYFPRIMLYGIRPISFGELALGQDESGNLTYNCTFTVDEIGTPVI